jgi:quercetin dioxygenase-like cupin family protein
VRGVALLLTISLSGHSTGLAQMPSADPADVGTIEGIVTAFYDVINGPAGAPRQWRRDSTLYMPKATFVSMGEKDGKPIPAVMTPEEFRRAVNGELVEKGFFETEVGHRVERFGNVAQVRSAYEMRRAANGPLLGRGVNYLLLYWDGTRWWIANAVWDDERPGNTLPPSWVDRKEPASASAPRIVQLAGSRDQPGLFAQRLTFPPGYCSTVHLHNGELHGLVLRGSLRLGIADSGGKLTVGEYPEGSFVLVPAGRAHVEGAKAGQEAELYVTGVGPIRTTIVDSANAKRCS